MIGKTLANYEILGRLGSGGMAEIYRARDLKLGREIALKVLPADLARNAERRQRFHREAKALANLKHPNIVTLYTAEEEGDVLFITMELVDGKTVRELLPEGGFSLREILKIGIPLVDALAYAHKQGVTHRDLKLTNIMVDQEGRPMVLDFGLVKLLEAETDRVLPDADPQVTGEGRVIGTAAYMSPEQAEGRPVDGRSDIFSLGIVLYEMATGRRPFKGDSSVSTISAILRDDPPQVHEVNHVLPRHLGRIIHRCLAKDPGRRYQVAADLRNELEDLKEEITSATGMSAFHEGPAVAGRRRGRSNPLWLGAAVGGLAVVLMLWQPWAGRQAPGGPAGSATAGRAAGDASRTMIAVLPFENLGPPEDAYFAGGVTQEINNALASVPDLGVISRTSAGKYSRTQKTVREIGEELGVDYVVEGSVRWQKGSDGPDRVRITPQLIRVADDTQLWSDQYDRELEDIFEIQSEIAGEIVNRLGETLASSGGGAVGGPPTRNVEAYQEYLKATFLWERATTPADWDSLFAAYERAVALDPGFIEAWTKLSMAHSRVYHNFEDRSDERLVEARKAADRIFEIVPDHPKGHVALGHYYYWGLKDYDQALAEFGKTGALLESDADVISAIAYINRRRVGKMEEALEQLEKALSLSPRDPLLAHETAYTLQCLRRYDEASLLYDVAIALAPEEDSYYQSKAANALYRTGDGRVAEAVALAAPAFTDADWNYHRSRYLVFAGEFEQALAFLEENPNPTVEGPTQYLPLSLWRALISWCTDDDARTRGFAREALEEIEARVAENPEDARYRLAASQAHALLGNAEEALRQGTLATELVPLSRDSLRAFDFKWRFAEVAGMIGEEDLALGLIQEILSLPGGVSGAYLRNDPWLATVHEDPRFLALLNGAS